MQLTFIAIAIVIAIAIAIVIAIAIAIDIAIAIAIAIDIAIVIAIVLDCARTDNCDCKLTPILFFSYGWFHNLQKSFRPNLSIRCKKLFPDLIQ